MRLDILLGIVTVLMTILGGITSIWPPQKKLGKMYVGGFVILGFFSIWLIVQQSNEAQLAQNKMQEKADREEKELRGKLDQSLLSQEYMRGQLDSIGLMIGKLGDGSTNSSMKALAVAIRKMGENSNWKPAHIVSVVAPKPGNFQIDHKLTCTPRNAVIQMTSPGIIWWESPVKMFDNNKLYLSASDEGLTAQVLIWCEP